MINATINETEFEFKTSGKVFSPGQIDKGTLFMLSHVDFNEYEKVLDLGCGYGVVGIVAAKAIGCDKVFMTDIDGEAIFLSKENAVLNGVAEVSIVRSDGFKELDQTGFDIILSNPPYHADFKVPKEFIEKGFNRLKIGGKMFMVTKRMDWYKNKLSAIFGGVQVFEHEGYFVFMAEKRQQHYENLTMKAKKKVHKEK